MGSQLSQTVDLTATPDEVFDHLDDQTRLAAHMTKSSMMMAGGRMSYDLDEGRGQVVGSHIRMDGLALGLRLFVDEVVTARDRPHSKQWETAGASQLVILSGYRMGFDITPTALGSRLTVWIDYDLPTGPRRWLGLLLGRFYGRWCLGGTTADAVKYFKGKRGGK